MYIDRFSSTAMEQEITKDDLEELLFGKHEKKRRKRAQTKHLPSFAEDTPQDQIPRQDSKDEIESEEAVVVPDSFVPETVTSVPETEPTSIPELSPDKKERKTEVKNQTRKNQSFEDFLDEII